MSEMRVLGKEGDTKVTWDADNWEEVEAAEATFDRLTKKGYRAFSVKKSGDKGSIVTKFDPEAEKIILIPPIVGG